MTSATDGPGAPVFLIGPRGCGKSTIGAMAAGELKAVFFDTDCLVEAEAGQSIEAIVESRGWPSFRDLESKILAACARPGAIIATGGGAILSDDNKRMMTASGFVVYLVAPAACRDERLSRCPKAGQRPPLAVHDTAEEREPLYRALASHCLDAARPAPDVALGLADLVRRLWALPDAQRRNQKDEHDQ